MTSIRTALEVGRVPAEPSTTVSLALRLTGIRVELDPRSRFRPSRKIRLTVDGVVISAVFQSPPGLSLWTWEIVSETPVTLRADGRLITTGSRIIIQPYAARPFKLRKKAKSIIIQDDVVLHLLSTSAIPGAICEHEHPDTNFRLFLLFVAEGPQMRVMDETDAGGQTATPGGGVQDVQPNPRMAPGFLEPCLISLQYLMQLLPSSASELYTTGKEARDALKRACDLASTGDLDEDINHLGKQIQGLLDYVQKPIFSEHLASLTQTVMSFLNLVENAAMFLEECLNPELNNDHVNPESRMTIMKDFDKQFTILKTSFTVRRDFSIRRLPYARKPAIVLSESALPAPFSVSGGTAWNSTGNQGQEQGSGKSKLERLRDALRPASMRADSLDLGCLGGTRTEFLSEITTWLDDQSASNVLWLCGAPGTGKTTISWSLIAELKRQQRCAGIFLFGQGEDRYRVYSREPSELWRTLAYEMARFHPAIESEIYDAVATQTDNKLDLNNVKTTFQKLVRDPLKATAMSLSDLSPVLLIDALEKCNQDSSWAMLLHTLSQWPSLPRHYKLIITSQPQSDILNVMLNVFEDKSIKRMDLSMGDVDNSVTTKEIRVYIEHRFAEMRRIDGSIPDDWPDFRAVSELVKHANGFFKWAVVAMDDLSSQRAEERGKRLSTIIEKGSATDFYFLNQYFRNTLFTTVGDSRTFRATMGTVVFSKEPLPMGDLHHFLRDRFGPLKAKDLTEMVNKLSPLITFSGAEKIVKLQHNAYQDYLVDQRCPSVWRIDKGMAHRRMATSCFKIMQRALRFNICGLESSYLMNEDVKDKDVLVKNSIPSYLSYACRFWGDHLHDVQRDNETEIVKLLKDFLTVHLFHWFEVLSLLDKSGVAAASLRVAATWLKGIDEKLSLFAADGSRFAVTFAEVIAKSAPHIYLSALPFTPPSSPIYTHYYPRFSRIVKILHEGDPRWPPVQFSLSMERSVCSISIHPDGERMAAGLDGGLVLVIDIKTGQTCFSLKGHWSSVRTVAYSQSGARIATGCDDGHLRVFAAKDGSLLSGPFSLHLDWIRSIAWSPDEKQILTGSDDNKVKVVAVETGEVIHTMAFHRSWVRAVISTQDTFISCSNDRTVQFYDQSTGQPWMSWSTMQTGDILTIAISRDKILASGGDDSTILLYNVDKNTAVHELLRGHTKAIRSLAFSGNGAILASGSDDCTVRLWNVHTGKNICDPLKGHTSGVSCVAFSPDMKQLITGGTDEAIKFFDISSLLVREKDTTGVTGQFLTATLLNNGRALLAFDGSRTWRSGVDDGNLDVNVENVPFDDHSDRLSKIQVAAISPDGELVATAASDYRVTIWQVKSGKTLYGPLSGHTGDISVLSFSVDSKMVASGSYDCNVWVWSANTGQAIHGPMECHERRVTGLCFSHDGEQVASGSSDDTAIIWSVDSGKKVVGPLEHHTDWIYGLAYSPDGLYLATASDDFTVAIWNSAKGEHVFHFPTGHKEYLRVINWSSDSRRIVTGALDNTIRVFDVKTGSLVCEPLTGHTTTPIAVAFRPPSFHHDVDSEIISVSQDGTARVWEIKTKDSTESQSHSKRHRDWILSVDISPVDDHIATGGDDGKLVVVDAISGSPKFSCDAHEYWIRCVTYSPDGMMIATCSDDGTISVWNADNGNRLLGPFNCNVGPVLSVAFSLDGNVLVSGNDDSTVRSWTLDHSTPGTILPLSTYVGHTCPVRTVACARMGERIVSGSEDAEIAVWEGRNGNKLVWKKQGHDGTNLSIAISGEEIFSGSEDKIIRVWDLDTGDIKSIIHGHTAPINALRLSPDGRWIVSASDDARMRVLDPHTGQQHVLSESEPMPCRIISIAISRDGKLVACCGADGQVHIWRPNMAAPVWPDNFIRRVRGLEYCPVDDQGIHVNTTLRDDGWLCRSNQGSTGEVTEAMCWIPPAHRLGLMTQWTKDIFGAPVTVLDARRFVHGTKWEQCSDDHKQLEPFKEMLQILLD